MTDENMFCFQCEQTAGCTACIGAAGVCGKTADVARLQDDLTGTLVALARAESGGRGGYRIRRAYAGGHVRLREQRQLRP